MAIGSVEPLKRLHARWGHRVHFVDVLIRQAHPGPCEPAYASEGQKMADAERYQRTEHIPWPVVVDDVKGTVHRAYGGLANPSYLIGTDGRVSFYAPVTGAPRLHRALEELVSGGGRGVVSGGIDLVPHLLTTFTDGWRALERGRPQSTDDLSRALPGSVGLLLVGRAVRPVLAPWALRARPLPSRTRATLLGVVSIALLSVPCLSRREKALDRRRRGHGVLPSARRRRSSSSSSISPRA
ncbi:MAG: hypothetical protein M3N15_07175 [Actinomycetota bacterium]|nr:hypothetical protein [Actinomycetota bacterium]